MLERLDGGVSVRPLSIIPLTPALGVCVCKWWEERGEGGCVWVALCVCVCGVYMCVFVCVCACVFVSA